MIACTLPSLARAQSHSIWTWGELDAGNRVHQQSQTQQSHEWGQGSVWGVHSGAKQTRDRFGDKLQHVSEVHPGYEDCTGLESYCSLGEGLSQAQRQEPGREVGVLNDVTQASAEDPELSLNGVQRPQAGAVCGGPGWGLSWPLRPVSALWVLMCGLTVYLQTFNVRAQAYLKTEIIFLPVWCLLCSTQRFIEMP